jgi:hypothetical protein
VGNRNRLKEIAMNRMTMIIAALSLTVPGAVLAQDGGAAPAEPMTFEMFQETYGNALDPASDDRIDFEILDTDNDGILSPEEQQGIEGFGGTDDDTDGIDVDD